MIELTILVPPAPILEKALGYQGGARWMAAWWERCGDMAMVSDGQVTRTGNYEGYLTYVGHFRHLYRFHLGNSDEPALEYLLIDRYNRRAFIGTNHEVMDQLRDQWPKLPPVHFTEEEWCDLVGKMEEQLKLLHYPTPEEIDQALQEKAAALAGLRAWLNQN